MPKTKKTSKTVAHSHDDHDHNHDHHDHDHDHHDHAHSHTSDPQQSLAIAPNSQVTVTLAWKKIEPVYQKHLQKVAQNVKAPGFRKGKVPPQLAESQIDRDKLFEQILQEVLPDAYTDVLKKENKLPISQPEIEPIQMEKGKDWQLKLHFAERPEIKLGKYQDLIKKTKKAIETEITQTEKELKENAKKKAAETKESDKKDEPEAPATLSDQRKEDIKMKHIFRALVESIRPQIPELLVRQEVNRELKRLIDQLGQFKLSVDEYLKSRQMTPDQLRQEYIGIGLSTLQIEFILAEIAKTEKITIEEKEIDEVLDKVADGKLSPEQRQDAEYRTYLFSTLTKQKVMKHLMSL